MKRLFISIIAVMFIATTAVAQAVKAEGKCGEKVKWTFDGTTLQITNVDKDKMSQSMDDYNLQNLPQWTKKKLNDDIKRIKIGSGVSKVGSCAFANMTALREVTFDDVKSVSKIGWGAFYNCTSLRTISLPSSLNDIETIAFANCTSLSSVNIPSSCRVGDQAFINCTGLKTLYINTTTLLGNNVFSSEKVIDGKVRHSLYNGEVRHIASYINEANCAQYGIAKSSISNMKQGATSIDYDEVTAEVDNNIPKQDIVNTNTYAIVIGNGNYRFNEPVQCAIHDAHVFAQYCNNTLGVPIENISRADDATKEMIQEELEWASNIADREDKKLIFYYAGHGVPDHANNNKSYLLPTDVRSSKPQRGISIDDLYKQLGDLGFEQTTIILDACFSGSHDGNSLDTGTRGVEYTAEEGDVSSGNVVVFAAAQGSETALTYVQKGHGLFTYFLLKKIQQTSGALNFGELSDYLKTNVSKTAPTLPQKKEQTPDCRSSESLSDRWQNLTF